MSPEVRAALCLCKFLDHFHSNNPESTTATNFADYVTVSVRNILPDISETPLSAENLSRAVATTPLTGIDIPFHSSFMKGGIPAFRRFLYSHIQTNDVDPAKLINRYVPNLTAKLFNLERCYFERTNEISNSPVLGRILERVSTVHPPPSLSMTEWVLMFSFKWDDFTLPGFSVDDAVDLLRSFRAAGI